LFSSIKILIDSLGSTVGVAMSPEICYS
jgi:hypothetical protein